MVVDELEGGTYNDVGLNGRDPDLDHPRFRRREPTPGNEMAYVVALPNMAATAHFHGKAQAPSVEGMAEEARQFAIGPYATALLKGQDLPQAERAAVRAELSRLTGLVGRISRTGRSARHRSAVLQGTAARPGADRRAAGSAATPGAITTMPGKRPTMIPASTASMQAMPPRSTVDARDAGLQHRPAIVTIGSVGGSGTGRWARLGRTNAYLNIAPLIWQGDARERGPADVRRARLV